MTRAAPYPLRFQIGARTLLTVRRPLHRIGYTLPDIECGEPLTLPPLEGAQGYVLTSLPDVLARDYDRFGMLIHVRQRYRRYVADFAEGYETYLAHFSAKTRGTLKRKRRQLIRADAVAPEVRSYRSPDELEMFLTLARPLARRTYQYRLLGGGLPESAAARAEMRMLAAADRLRAFLLFHEDRPIAYLYLPVFGGVLIYDQLGYDPSDAALSPGTVLQLEAIRLLAEEGRYTRLDFTEGDGAHKRLFATQGFACVDLLLLRPNVANRLIIAAFAGFDCLVSGAKMLAVQPAFSWFRRVRR